MDKKVRDIIANALIKAYYKYLKLKPGEEVTDFEPKEISILKRELAILKNHIFPDIELTHNFRTLYFCKIENSLITLEAIIRIRQDKGIFEEILVFISFIWYEHDEPKRPRFTFLLKPQKKAA